MKGRDLRLILAYIFLFILFNSCKKDPPLFSYSKTIGNGFSSEVQLLINGNSMYYYDTFSDMSAFGSIDPSTGNRANLFYVNTNATEIAFDGEYLYYIQNDSLYSKSLQSKQVIAVDKLNYPKTTMTLSYTLFADEQNLYYVKYDVGEYKFFKYSKSAKQTNALTTITYNFTAIQDKEALFIVRGQLSMLEKNNTLIKVDKATGNTQKLFESYSQITLLGIDENKVYYRNSADSSYTYIPSSPPVAYYHHGTCHKGPKSFVLENGFCYQMSQDWGENLGTILTRKDAMNGNSSSIASSVHGIVKVITSDDQYLYVLDKSGVIGLIKL